MAHTLRPSKHISYDENMLDPSDYLTDIKQEPLDSFDEITKFGVKNEVFQYQNDQDNHYQNVEDFTANDPFPASLNTWSLLVKRCRFLIQEEYQHNQMNSYLLSKLLVKEVNELLSNVVTFFQDCCVTVNQDEYYSESTLEVDGLLVNCLPCHPQNTSCYYRISSDIPEVYLETLFCPLDNEIENNDYNGDAYLPLAPEVEIDIKKEGLDVKVVKKNKRGPKPKEKKPKEKNIVCDQCGRGFKNPADLKVL